MNKSYISVAGTLGVGKTTMVKIIAEEFGYYPVVENFRDNPFLEKFYKDMKRWAFHSQTFFLLEKIKQLQMIEKLIKKHPVVQDVPIYEDVYSYAKAQLILGNIHKDEWGLYLDLYEMFKKTIPLPKLIIYLSAPVSEIQKRVVARDRKVEEDKDKKPFRNYLQLLQKLNDDWIASIGKKIKIVPIQTDGFNYITNKKERKRLIDLLRKYI